MGLKLPRQSRAIVVGCGMLGASLASGLSTWGYDVCVIDQDARSFHRLSDGFQGFTDIGDGTSADVLERNGIADAAMVLALSSRDDTNILTAELASRIYGVPQVFARLFDEHKEVVLDGFGVKVLCPRRLCENRFAELSGIPIREVLQ
jgi:trk system potassium uptake protein TrkA